MTTDILHEKSTHPEWNESFYFNFYDKDNNICAFMRIGIKPNKNEKSMFCGMMLPEDTIAYNKGTTIYDSGELETNGLRFELIKSEKEWALTYDGFVQAMGPNGKYMINCSFNLRFIAKMPIFDYRDCVCGENEKLSQSVASEHLEQMGTVHGTLHIGDDCYEIEASGERDHSWGVRDWNAPTMWIWLTSQTAGNTALNVTKLILDKNEVDAGFIRINGSTKALEKVSITPDYDNANIPRGLKMTLTDQEGTIYPVEASVMRYIPMPFSNDDGSVTSMMYETLSKYSIDGVEGYGIAEFLIRKD